MSDAYDRDPQDMPDEGGTFRLHPEGAPGFMSGVMRHMLGDQQYEQNEQRNAERHDKEIEHATVHNRLVLAQAKLVEAITIVIVLGVLAASAGTMVWLIATLIDAVR